jgi:3-hydroxy-3-methylglutaryl CoA synthase
MERGILSYGAYIPMLRIDRGAIAAANAWAFPGRRGNGARALANWDEDAVTMSVEAARGVDLEDVGSVLMSSVTAPYADLQNAMLVSSALGLAAEIATLDVTGSLRAGTSAMLTALKSGEESPALVVAADARIGKPGSAQEMQYGAGSVAFRVGSGDDMIARLIASSTRADQFVDHFRATGETFDYYWEERWIRDEGYAKIVPAAVKVALAKTNVVPEDITHFCMPTLLGGAGGMLAKAIGIPATAVADTLQARCGDTGSAHALMMLAAALESAKPGDKILVVSFGAGCDVLLFEATDAIAGYSPRQGVAAALASGKIDANYTKMLSFHGQFQLDWGMRAEGSEKVPLTQQYRSRGQLATFDAGKCQDCGTIQFPQLATCVNCGSFNPFTQHRLVGEPARMATYTADWLQYHPAPPFYFGLVQFDNGARVMMEIVDVDPAHLDVGTPVRMVFRIKSRDQERHYNRYFWKATPLGAISGD